MMFLYVSVAVLSLLSVGQTAPLSSCESLIQPPEIQGVEQFTGKWMRVALSSNHELAEWMVKRFQGNFWTNITADNTSNVLTFTEVKNIYGFCATQTYQVTLVNNTLQAVTSGVQRPEISSGTTLLKTSCPDCLLLLNQSPPTFGRSVRGLVLMSKRQTVTAAELEELKAQAECLNMFEPFTMDSGDELCPDPQSPGADVFDLTKPESIDPAKQEAMMNKVLSQMGNMRDMVKKFAEAKIKN